MTNNEAREYEIRCIAKAERMADALIWRDEEARQWFVNGTVQGMLMGVNPNAPAR